MRRFFSTRTYIALGLASIVSSTLLASSFLGLIPDRVAAQREGRLALAESVAAGSTALLGSNDPSRVDALLRFILKRNDQLLSVALRAQDGKVPLSIGEHANRWVPMDSSGSSSAQIAVPVFAGSQPWGTRTRPSLRAWAAICKSFTPIGCPIISRDVRIEP